MNTDFEKYRNQLSEWFQNENSKIEFFKVWDQAINESNDLTRRMEITEDTLVKVIGI